MWMRIHIGAVAYSVAYLLATRRLARGLRQVLGAPLHCAPGADGGARRPFCQPPGPAGLAHCNFCAVGTSKTVTSPTLALPPAEAGQWHGSTAAIDNSSQKGKSMSLSEPPRSGRRGEWVYYMRGNKQCRRRYVRPGTLELPANCARARRLGTLPEPGAARVCPQRRGRA